MNSIIVSLFGGLGNQMFQYAIGRRLSLSNNCSLVLDDSWFYSNQDGVTRRSFDLRKLKIQAKVYTLGRKQTIFAKAMRKSKLVKTPIIDRVVIENDENYDGNLFKSIGPNTHLRGYWQSYRYFEDIKDVLAKDFMPKRSLYSSLESGSEFNVKNETAIAIHVRRGDFVHNKKVMEFHGYCSFEYFNSAIKLIRSNVKDPLFCFFSDDMPWVKKQFADVENKLFLSGKGAIHDLCKMRYCNHHILSNSTFGWWGAWLCSQPDQLVVCPKRWFAVKKNDTDLIPSNWIRL